MLIRYAAEYQGMRKGTRISLGVLAAISLVFVLLVAVLWVWSTMAPLPIVVDVESGRTRFWTTHQHGTLHIWWREIQPLPDGTWGFTGNHVDARLTDPSPNRFGFGFNSQPAGAAPPGAGAMTRQGTTLVAAAGNNGQWARAGSLSVPYWSPLLLFASLPSVWVLKYLRRRRASRAPGFEVLPTVSAEARSR